MWGVVRRVLRSVAAPAYSFPGTRRAGSACRFAPEAESGLERAADTERITRALLVYAVLPIWLAAGFLDYLQHRRTRIEQTAGTHESVVHALMMLEAALPSLLGLFMEVNAGVLLLAVGALLAHEATAFWDVAYAVPRREVAPNEQHIHSLLEVMPLVATSYLLVLHWDQARALAGLGPARADFRLGPKKTPLSRGYVAAILAALVALNGLPYAEEFRRCYRAHPSLRPKPPAPPPRYGVSP